MIPPAPSIASAQTAAEQVEHYWAALMRDVHFEDYASSPLAAQACADRTTCPTFRARTIYFLTQLHRRICSAGDSSGDGSVQVHLSQFLMQPCFLGIQPMGADGAIASVGEGGADYSPIRSSTSALERISAIVQPAVRSGVPSHAHGAGHGCLRGRSIRHTLSPA